MKLSVWYGIIIGVLILSLAGCGASARRTMNVPTDKAGDFDPFAYGDEFNSRPRQDTADNGYNADSGTRLPVMEDAGNGPESNTGMRRLPVSDGDDDDAVYGYRVQIGIDRDKDRMEALAQRARKRLDIPVYLEYAAPFYRVRVGNYKDRDDAERYVKEYKSKGFRDALSVMSEISANEAIQ